MTAQPSRACSRRAMADVARTLFGVTHDRLPNGDPCRNTREARDTTGASYDTLSTGSSAGTGAGAAAATATEHATHESGPVYVSAGGSGRAACGVRNSL